MVPMLFVDYDSVDADPASGLRYYLFCDQRGCPERVVDDQGQIVWQAYVEPYGMAHVRVGEDFYQPLRFPGHFWDAELGLHYNHFRYYSPWLGRYLQVDKLGEGGGWNVYGYTTRPLTRVDVRGLNDGCGGPNPQEQSNAQEAGDASDTQYPPDPEGTYRDANGRLRNSPGQPNAGRYARDPRATGRYIPDVRTGRGRPIDVGEAGLDPSHPQTASALRERRSAMRERDRLRAAGDEQGARRAQARANRATESLGEQATDATVPYLRNAAGEPVDVDVEGAHRGRGPGTFDRVYENRNPPPRFIIAEGKGGSARNTSSRMGEGGWRYQQGTDGYRESVADNMRRNGRTAQERRIGEELVNASPDDIRYIEVSQPIGSDGSLGQIRARDYEDAE